MSIKNADHPIFVYKESSKSFEVTVFETFKNSKDVASFTKFQIPIRFIVLSHEVYS